jgi:UDP-glucuronate decarboxylase
VKAAKLKRVMVTGGAGFLGSHVCDCLVEGGDFVLCVDDFYTGSRANIAHLIGHPRFALIRHDVTIPLDAEVDEIYNLASPASPLQYQRDPVRTTKTNVLGAIHLLELAAKKGAKILQASTSEVYGDPEVHPQPERYWGNVNPIGVRACYEEGKRCAETLFFDFHRQHALRVKVARIFNTYGPRMRSDDGRVVSNFVVAALREEPLTVYGDGSQTRSFCHVHDLVRGLVRLMQSGDECTGPVNFGSADEITIEHLAKRVIAQTRSRSTIRHAALPGDDPSRRKPDLRLARRRLGWEPTIDLDAGLASTIAYFARRPAPAAAAGALPDPGVDPHSTLPLPVAGSVLASGSS